MGEVFHINFRKLDTWYQSSGVMGVGPEKASNITLPTQSEQPKDNLRPDLLGHLLMSKIQEMSEHPHLVVATELSRGLDPSIELEQEALEIVEKLGVPGVTISLGDLYDLKPEDAEAAAALRMEAVISQYGLDEENTYS